MNGYDILAINDRNIARTEQSITRLPMAIDQLTQLGRKAYVAEELLAVVSQHLERPHRQRRRLIRDHFSN